MYHNKLNTRWYGLSTRPMNSINLVCHLQFDIEIRLLLNGINYILLVYKLSHSFGVQAFRSKRNAVVKSWLWVKASTPQIAVLLLECCICDQTSKDTHIYIFTVTLGSLSNSKYLHWRSLLSKSYKIISKLISVNQQSLLYNIYSFNFIWD